MKFKITLGNVKQIERDGIRYPVPGYEAITFVLHKGHACRYAISEATTGRHIAEADTLDELEYAFTSILTLYSPDQFLKAVQKNAETNAELFMQSNYTIEERLARLEAAIDGLKKATA